MDIYVSQFLIFMMLFARTTALIVVAPVLGHQSIPVQIKVAFGMFFSLVLYPLASTQAPVIDSAFLPFVLMVLKEVAVGLVIGFATGLVFAGVRFAGELISVDTGLSIASVFDPESNTQTSIIGEFMYLVMLMVFIILDGHHFVFEALYLSYTAVPIGNVTLGPMAGGEMVKLAGIIFVVAIKLAAPVIVAMFLMNVALSILSRVLPQMNIFAVAFPMKIGAGFFVLTVAAPLLVFVFKKLLAGFEENVFELIKVL